jgi:molybdopterin molybdotransferase
MIRFWPFDEAVAKVHTLASPLDVQQVPVDGAVDRVMAQDAFAAVDVPPFDRAMMDGFAIRSNDAVPSRELKVIGTLPAGQRYPDSLQPGQALRIMTGAPVPAGADAVARFEWCDQPTPGTVVVLHPVAPGESIQPAGQDCQQGQVVVERGTRLTSAHAALLKTCGISYASVFQKPTVAILVTGSELCHDPSRSLRAGQIYGCDDLLVAGGVAALGGTVLQIEYVTDNPRLIGQALERYVNQVNCVITTGGVSAGDCDFVPEALRQLGAQLHIEKVWMRPGSPFVAATLGDTVVFGLSGNPAACTVQFETLVRAYFDGCFGRDPQVFPASGILEEELHLKPIKHVRILRATAAIEDGQVRVHPGVSQSPGVLSSLASANCLIRMDESDALPGTVVPLRWLRA